MVEAELAAMRNRTFLDVFYFGCTFEAEGYSSCETEGICPKAYYTDYLGDLSGSQTCDYYYTQVSMHTWPTLNK